MTARDEHAHSLEEAPDREGDAAAWDRPLRESELYAPERRDIFNFIDETKVRHLRPLLPASRNAIEIGAGSGPLLIPLRRERPPPPLALDHAPHPDPAGREEPRRARPGGHPA